MVKGVALKAVNAFRRWVKESLGVVRGEAHLYDARSKKIGLAMVRELSQDDIVQVANGDRPAWFTDEKVRELFFQPEAVVQEEVMEEEAEAAEAAADPGQRLRNRMRNTYLTLHRTALYKRAVIDAGKTWEDERTRNLLWRRLGRDDFNALCVDGPEYLSLMLTTLRAQPKERDPAGKTNKT